MADSMKFPRVAQPSSTGNTCATCGTHAHPDGFFEPQSAIIKEMTIRSGLGAFAICANCVDELIRSRGGLDPAQNASLHGIVDELTETCERLGSELAAEKVDKVVPLAEIMDFFEERAKRRPDEEPPATEPKASKPKASA